MRSKRFLPLSVQSKYLSEVKPSNFLSEFRIDAQSSRLRFAMTPHAPRNCHLAAPDAPSVLRPKPANLSPPDVDACPTSCQVSRRLQDLSCSRRTGSLLELSIVFLLDLANAIFITSMYSCSFMHHVDHPLLRPDFLDASVQVYSRSPFTALGPSA